MGPLNYENELLVDEENKKLKKFEKSLILFNIIYFKTIRYKLTASGIVIHLIYNYRLMRPVSILRLPKK